MYLLFFSKKTWYPMDTFYLIKGFLLINEGKSFIMKG